MHQKVEHVIRKILTVVEVSLAVLTLVVLVGNLGIEAYRVIIDPSYFPGSEEFLHNMLALAEDRGIVVMTSEKPMYLSCGELYLHGLRGSGQ